MLAESILEHELAYWLDRGLRALFGSGLGAPFGSRLALVLS